MASLSVLGFCSKTPMNLLRKTILNYGEMAFCVCTLINPVLQGIDAFHTKARATLL